MTIGTDVGLDYDDCKRRREERAARKAARKAAREEARRSGGDQSLRTVLRLGALFWVPAIVYLLDGASYFGLLNVLGTHLGRELGLGDAAAGLRVAFMTAGLTAAGFLLGGLVDKWGARRLLAASLAAGVAGRALLAVAPKVVGLRSATLFWSSMSVLAFVVFLYFAERMCRGWSRVRVVFLLLVGSGGYVASVIALCAGPQGSVNISGAATWLGLALVALSVGTLSPAVYAAAKKAVGKTVAAGLAFALLYALMNGGQVLEGLASPFVRARWGTTGVVWVCAGIALLALVVHLLFYPRERAAHAHACPACGARTEWRREGIAVCLACVARHGADPYRTPAVDVAPPLASSDRHPLKDPRFLFFIFALLGVRTLFAHQWLTMPAYMQRAYPGGVADHFEWLLNLNPLIILFATPLMALLTRRVHVVTMMTVGTLVSAGATLLLVPGPDTARLVAYIVVFTLGEALWSSRFLEYVAEAAPEGRVGLYQGAAQLPWFVAKFTTGLYSGWMLSVFCPAGGPMRTGTMWAVYAAVGLTSPVLLLVAGRWLKSGRLGRAVA